MGHWAKIYFNISKASRVGFIFAGTTLKEHEKKLLNSIGKPLFSKDVVFHTHLIKINKTKHTAITNVYGAPAIVDALSIMHDAGVRNVIFIGYAYGGFDRNLPVGSIVIPNKSYHFDGIYSSFDPKKTISLPNTELRCKVKEIFKSNEIKFFEGSNISVPAVTFQLPHANKKYKKIKPVSLEMEVAAFYSRAREIGMRATAILIISDNRTSSINNIDRYKIRENAKKIIVKYIVKNISKLNLTPLKTKKIFNIDKHLASIIYMPGKSKNVYKRKKKKKSKKNKKSKKHKKK